MIVILLPVDVKINVAMTSNDGACWVGWQHQPCYCHLSEPVCCRTSFVRYFYFLTRLLIYRLQYDGRRLRLSNAATFPRTHTSPSSWSFTIAGLRLNLSTFMTLNLPSWSSTGCWRCTCWLRTAALVTVTVAFRPPFHCTYLLTSC